MHVLHLQHQRLALFGEILLLLGLAFCLLLPILIDDLIAMIVCWSVAVLTFLSYLNFDRLSIIVSRDEIRAGFPVFNSRIALKDIRAAEPIDHLSFWRWGGLGIRFRFGASGGLGYIMRSGPAIRIRAEGRRDLVFTCQDPGAIIAALADGGCRALKGQGS